MNCFICTNLGKENKAQSMAYGFHLCNSHFKFLTYKEEKADGWGVPVWKEIWDDTNKTNIREVEVALNFLIVEYGAIDNLSEDIINEAKKLGLYEKYASLKALARA